MTNERLLDLIKCFPVACGLPSVFLWHVDCLVSKISFCLIYPGAVTIKGKHAPANCMTLSLGSRGYFNL